MIRLARIGALGLCVGFAGCYTGAPGDQQDASGSADEGTISGPGSGTETADDGGTETDGVESQCEDLDPGPFLVRRLTSWEYDNTVATVLGVDASDVIESSWPDELHAAGFSNTANALIVSFDHVETFMELAQTIVTRVDWPTLLATHATCTDMTSDCQRGFVQSLGTALFRAPLDDARVDAYAAPFEAAQAEGEGFEAGAQLVLRSMLQSARFLYRLEDQPAGGESFRNVTDHELAVRLSYLVTGGPPDQALADAAAAGDVQVRSQVERMLATPEARTQSSRYISDWLRLDDLDDTVRDSEEFPAFSPELVEDMKRESLAMADYLIWEEQAPLLELLTARYTVASDQLATFYGLTPTGEGDSYYDLSGLPERMGILTQAGLLTHVGGAEANMVERGLFMLRNVLCSEVPPPPPGIDASPVEIEPGKTRRFYSDERTTNASCSCHLQFDPLAHGFERYDGVGAYATEDEFGNELRADGQFTVPFSGESLEWTTTEQFIDALAAADATQRCMVQKPLQFAIGRPVEDSDADQCALDEIQALFAEDGGTYQALIITIATHPSFHLVRGE